MKNDTLFGKLAFHLAKHPENLAVEALGFILGRSASARRAIALLSRRAEINVNENLVYRTHGVGEDLSRPDLIGTDGAGREVLSIEAGYGQYIRLGGAAAWFGISYPWWAQFRAWPLWLRFWAKNDVTPMVRVRLADFEPPPDGSSWMTPATSCSRSNWRLPLTATTSCAASSTSSASWLTGSRLGR